MARWRRRAAGVAGLVALAGAGVVIASGLLGEAVREVTLPLRHDDIIRQQAEEKDLDPALIAAVIYQETRFRPRTSSAGAQGLMQITPQTARDIAERSGAQTFEIGDLGDPQINIAYGAYYLRHLIDRYEGEQLVAAAAYNAGPDNVDRWIADAGGVEEFDVPEDIPYPETRDYVEGVKDRRDDYRQNYADELGL